MKIAILGAGISGLAAGWFFKQKYKKKIEIAIYEQAARPGGWIRTDVSTGFLFEAGPRGFRPQGKGKITLELIKELGLENRLLAAHPQVRLRYIWQEGKLTPLTPYFLLRQGIFSAFFRDLFTSPQSAEDETLFDFISRRFNKKFAENLIDPLALGIFGGDSKQLSVRSCFPQLWRLEKEKKSLFFHLLKGKKEKGLPSLYSFQEGMEILPRRIQEKLDAAFYFSYPIQSLDEIDADVVISALPLSALARIAGLEDPLKYATISTVSFGWKAQVLPKRGYGFLIPTKENSPLLGMTWDSEIFPEQNSKEETRVCVMVGGALSEEQLYALGREGLEKYLSIRKIPDAYIAQTALRAIPQYTLYHFKQIEELTKKLPDRLKILGNWYEGVGVNDCIFNAKRLADNYEGFF